MTFRALDWRSEVQALQRLVRLCHPDRTERNDLYWFVHPTMVLSIPLLTGKPRFVAYSSVLVTHDALFGVDMGVHPDFRRQGLGLACLTARKGLAEALGLRLLTGQTQVDNVAMQRAFERAGYEKTATIEKYYTDVPEPKDAIVYMKNLSRLETSQ